MTTWLRVGVGAMEGNKISRHMPQRPHFYLKTFSDQSYTGYWYFGNWLQINNQQQYTQYTISTNGRRLPCGYKSCPVAHDKNCLPPNNPILLQVFISLYLSNTVPRALYLYYSIFLYSVPIVYVYRYHGLLYLVLFHITCWVANPTRVVLYHYQYHSTSIMYVVLLQTITK